MFTVVGKIRKNGNFNGLEYDNTFLHCTREPNNSNEIGTLVEVLKVKTEFASIVSIGDNINVFYDKFGKISKLETL